MHLLTHSKYHCDAMNNEWDFCIDETVRLTGEKKGKDEDEGVLVLVPI